MNSVNFYRTYQLDNIYERVKENSGEILGKYLNYPDLYHFNDDNKTLRFKAEILDSFSYPSLASYWMNPGN